MARLLRGTLDRADRADLPTSDEAVAAADKRAALRGHAERKRTNVRTADAMIRLAYRLRLRRRSLGDSQDGPYLAISRPDPFDAKVGTLAIFLKFF